MKILVDFLVYFAGFWYTVMDCCGRTTLDNETETAFLIAEVTGAWWCPWSSKPVWGR